MKQPPELLKCQRCPVWSSDKKECAHCGAPRTGKEKKL